MQSFRIAAMGGGVLAAALEPLGRAGLPFGGEFLLLDVGLLTKWTKTVVV